MMNPNKLILASLLALLSACGDYTSQKHSAKSAKESGQAPESTESSGNLLQDTYSPLHFKPAIETASDEQCLACHKEVLDDRVRKTSPAGVEAATSLAWYQLASTYKGDQETFHLVQAQHLSFIPRAQTGETVLCFSQDPTLEQIEREYLHQVMAKYGGNRHKTATVLGISERHVYRLIEKYRES